MIEIPMNMQGDTMTAVEAFAKHAPLKRVAKPDEVWNLVLYLASNESIYSTGSQFVVDGGIVAQ